MSRAFLPIQGWTKSLAQFEIALGTVQVAAGKTNAENLRKNISPTVKNT